MNKYGFTIVFIVIWLILAFYGYPYVKGGLDNRAKVCTDETAKLEKTRREDAQLTAQQTAELKENAPYALYDQKLASDFAAYAKPEDASKMIINEASRETLKIGPSKLQATNKDVQTLEGGVIPAREFVITVEGDHTRIGEWLARVEATVRTCRPEEIEMYPVGPVVGARVTFLLLSGNMSAAQPGAEAKTNSDVFH